MQNKLFSDLGKYGNSINSLTIKHLRKKRISDYSGSDGFKVDTLAGTEVFPNKFQWIRENKF